MAISDAVRREVMERDRGVCQFFHREEVQATEISHRDHQGAGGLPPEHWKNQPGNLAASCGECHARFPYWQWLGFEPATIVNSNAQSPGIMRIVSPDGVEVPEHELWFHNRWRKLAAIMAARSLQTVAEIDCSIGEMMADLRDGAEFLAGARSFEEHVSGLGWDPVKANEIADVWEWASIVGGWPATMNFSKMKLLHDAKWIPGQDPAQWIEQAAAGTSYSTIQKELIQFGLREAQMRIYLVCSPEVLAGGSGVSPVLVRTRDEEKLLDASRGLAVLRLNAIKGALRYKRGEEGGVFDKETGREIPLVSIAEWVEARKSDAAGTSWNADRLAEEKAREALRAVIDDHEERSRTYGKMETQIHRVAVMQQAAEALRLLEERP